MIERKSPFTSGYYGPLGAYLQLPLLALSSLILLIGGKIESLRDLQFLVVTHEGYFLFIPRVISAMFGVLSVIATYALSKELFSNKRAALWASFFAAVSFNMVHISHQARPWSGAVFFSILASIFVVKSLKDYKNEYKNTLLAFITSALSFGFHQIAGLSAIFVILTRIFERKVQVHNVFSKVNLAGFLTWFILISAFNFLSLKGKFFTLLNYRSNEASSIAYTKLPQTLNSLKDFLTFFVHKNDFLAIFKMLFLSDGVIVLLAVLFLVSKAAKRKVLYGFFIFVLVNFLLSIFIFQTLSRNYLIAFSFLPIFAGFQINHILTTSKRRLMIITLVLIVSGFNSVYWNILLLKKPTFIELREWLDQNIDQRTPIASTNRRNFDYVPSLEAILPVRTINPGYYKAATDIIGDSYPENVRNVIYLNEFSGSKTETFNKATQLYKILYVVDSYWAAGDRFLNTQNSNNLKLIAHFSPSMGQIYDYLPNILFDSGLIFNTDRLYFLFDVDRAGPYFDVLKVKTN